MPKLEKIIIIGNGLSALSATLYLLGQGLDVQLLTHKKNNVDKRTTAILEPGLKMLRQSDNIFADLGMPLKILHIADYSAKYLAPINTVFRASDIQLESFAVNVDNEILKKIFIQCIKKYSANAIVYYDTINLIESKPTHQAKIIYNENNVIKSDLVVLADRKQLANIKPNIKFHVINSNKLACIYNLEHEYSHNFTSYEIMTENETMTTIPVDTHLSSLIWIVDSKKLTKLNRLKTNYNDFLVQKLCVPLGKNLGKMRIDANAMQSFSLNSQLADRFYYNNIIFLGETIHKTLPIAAQGFNLCLGDLQCLANGIRKIHNFQMPLDKLGPYYEKVRYKTAYNTILGIHSLGSIFFDDAIGPLGIMRRLAMHFINNSSAVRNRCMALGLNNSYN